MSNKGHVYGTVVFSTGNEKISFPYQHLRMFVCDDGTATMIIESCSLLDMYPPPKDIGAHFASRFQGPLGTRMRIAHMCGVETRTCLEFDPMARIEVARPCELRFPSLSCGIKVTSRKLCLPTIANGKLDVRIELHKQGKKRHCEGRRCRCPQYDNF